MTFVMHRSRWQNSLAYRSSGEERLMGSALRLLDIQSSPRSRGRRVDVWLTVSGWVWAAYLTGLALAVWMVL